MSRFKMIGLMIAALCFALLSCSNDGKEVIENGEIKIPEPDVIYNPDNETVFPNPERGFAPALEAPKPELFTWDFCEQDVNKYTPTDWVEPMDLWKLKGFRDQGMTLVMIRYHIAEFRFKPISQEFLNRLTSDFSTIRQAGVKAVLRFVYNWWNGGPDAPKDQILAHMEQLRPILEENVDVIAFMDLGFVGCFGEVHSSAFGNLDDRTTPGFNSLNQNTIEIIDKLFDVLPEERMITFRHPAYKFQYFNGVGLPVLEANKPIAPLAEDEAFKGSKKARWGALEDCLVCSEFNCGTWQTPRNNAAEIRDFLNKDNLYVVQSGESGTPCGCDGPADDADGDGYTDAQRAGCERSLKMMALLRWSVMNASFAEQALDKWRLDGCYDEISRKLGYRYRLVESYVSDEAIAGGEIQAVLRVVNDGWASCYNPRDLQLILRHKETGAITKLLVDTSDRKCDPRFWLPGTTHNVVIDKLALPENLAKGEYQVLLNLPDPKSTLAERPEYSIRLANIGLWEPETGYNDLKQALIIK